MYKQRFTLLLLPELQGLNDGIGANGHLYCPKAVTHKGAMNADTLAPMIAKSREEIAHRLSRFQHHKLIRELALCL